MRLIAVFALLLFLTACGSERLTVHNEWLTLDDLASTHVDTPDHRQDNPPLGQRLYISWYIPEKSWERYEHIELLVKLRYGNREQKVLRHPLQRSRGRFTYQVIQEEYFEKRGISAYLVELRGDGELMEEWRHQLWAEVIRVGEA